MKKNKKILSNPVGQAGVQGLKYIFSIFNFFHSEIFSQLRL
jgi:hypothetical protein